VTAADETTRYDAAKSVLELAVGDAIRITGPEFRRLSRAFFAAIDAKFVWRR
jgi:hypothetical protein